MCYFTHEEDSFAHDVYGKDWKGDKEDWDAFWDYSHSSIGRQYFSQSDFREDDLKSRKTSCLICNILFIWLSRWMIKNRWPV
jgi:hypothetical protein